MIEPNLTVYPNIPSQILLNGAQDLLGAESLRCVLGESKAGLTSGVRNIAYAPFLAELENRYGEPGGRGLSLRIGRAAFQYSLRHFQQGAGLKSQAFRLLPGPRRLEKGLHILAGFMSSTFNDRVTVTNEGGFWLWRSENCPVCRDRQTIDPCCYWMVGWLQEFLSWAGGGRYYRVMETECQGVGDAACVYTIDQKAID